VASFCPVLERVAFRHCPLVGDRALMALAARCPRLTAVHASHAACGPAGVVALAGRCPLLTEASFGSGSSPQVNDEALAALARGCPQLRSLEVPQCGDVSDAG